VLSQHRSIQWPGCRSSGTLLLLLGLLTGCAAQRHIAATASRLPSPPPRAVPRPVIDHYHGEQVVDPYRFMEDLEDPEVLDWMQAQDTYARAVLASIPGVAQIEEELEAIRRVMPAARVLFRAGDRFFLARGGRLHVRDGLSGPERLLFDPTDYRIGDATPTVLEAVPSPDGRHVLLSLAIDGHELTPVFHVMDAERGALLADSIHGGFDIGVASPRGTTAWLPDGSGFVYIRRRDLPTDSPLHEQTVGMEARLHVLGTDPGTDRVVFGGAVSRRLGLPADAWPWLEFSHGSPHVLALVSPHDGSNPVFFATPVDSLHAAVIPWRQVVFQEDEVRGPLGWIHFGEHVYLKSAMDAPNFQVLRRNLSDPTAPVEVVVGEGDGVIDGLAATRDALYVTLLTQGRHRLLRVPHVGEASRIIELPYEGAIAQWDLITDPQRPELLFGFSSPSRFPRYYIYDPAVGAAIDTGWIEPPAAERELDLRAVFAHARSADGTEVPISLAFPGELVRDGSSPAWLQVYAAYGTTASLSLHVSMVPWYRRGGVMAICHARGGGENGIAWQRAGSGENLPNRIADTIACAQFLIEHGYSAPRRVAIEGASAGGVSAGGALVRRPELFGTALLHVPALDLLRFERTLSGPGNVAQLGSVATPNGFRTLRTVSPYANIREGTAYPAVLLSTGINDRTVPPSDAARMAARLQAATSGTQPILLRVDWQGGHAASSGSRAERTAFVLWQLGHPDFQLRE
jgi:prolyl oligopeptidase